MFHVPTDFVYILNGNKLGQVSSITKVKIYTVDAALKFNIYSFLRAFSSLNGNCKGQTINANLCGGDISSVRLSIV
jgi:hypothetical protein